ncbi:NAD(P)H-dependent oxidoreductase [Phototrophicus methaneseepsis]|uniref:NAD(P)H-dependent oxidoreductase n=1 Tax=Phototrophicus methaneseepsis TaxID=2710758 RepID=A0A7S8IDL1_9CHLR|nr:NAD(P)H-dependent oxidoreductase [Phototrophicus methaneseepsis]QPC82725.1 NAD(P)H-dependent oxidoreductase [Phototrophicus methaneseepsis]
MLNLQVLITTTRPTRRGPLVAKWFAKQARKHNGFSVELVDLAEFNLPIFDEPNHPRKQDYVHEHTKAWSKTIQRGDAHVFVMPEYNSAPPSSLLNAITYLNHEWSYKPYGFVSYGGVSAGTRGAMLTKTVMMAFNVVVVPQAVSIPFFSKHIDEAGKSFDPGEVQENAASAMLDEMLKWAKVTQPLRQSRLATSS